jgi:hypothetical protein
MRLKLISCQVLTREMNHILSRSPHSIVAEMLPMGLHDLGASMRPHLQERIDAADRDGYDAILRAGKTQLVLPRAHDCIGLLMGSRLRYQAYFDTHPGVYFRSPGWIEHQVPGQALEPAHSAVCRTSGERQTREELIAQYGEDNGDYLFEQFNAYRRRYSGLTYISSGVESEDAFRSSARAEAEKEGWTFEVIEGSLALLEQLVNGTWGAADFLVVPPGAIVHGTLGDTIVEAL